MKKRLPSTRTPNAARGHILRAEALFRTLIGDMAGEALNRPTSAPRPNIEQIISPLANKLPRFTDRERIVIQTMAAANDICSRADLHNAIWPPDTTPPRTAEDMLDSLVASVKRKLRAHGIDFEIVRGVGCSTTVETRSQLNVLIPSLC